MAKPGEVSGQSGSVDSFKGGGASARGLTVGSGRVFLKGWSFSDFVKVAGSLVDIWQFQGELLKWARILQHLSVTCG